MIRIQLWSGNRLLRETQANTAASAEQQIDELITETHTGKHGSGRFTLEADHVDPRRNSVFLGCMWRSDNINVSR